MKRYIIVVLLFFSQLALYSQSNDLNIYFETKTSGSDYVEVNVKADGYTQVESFQMYFQWDSTVFEYDTVSSYNHLLDDSDTKTIDFFNGGFIGEGILSAQWFVFSKVDLSLDDGTTLFTIRFKYKGDPCDETSLRLVDPLVDSAQRYTYVTYSWSNDASGLPIAFDEGNFKIPGDNCGEGGNNCKGFTLNIEKKCAKQNDEVCVKFVVDSFINISALNFSVSWDTTIVSWVKIGDNSNWARSHGGHVTTFNPHSNTFRYLMDADPPLNLAKGGSLIDLCFKVNPDAAEGDLSFLSFTDSLPFDVESTTEDFANFCLGDGSILVGDCKEAVTFTASEEEADLSEETCVSITAKQFIDISGFQMYVKWDPSVINYKGIGNVNKIDIQEGTSGNIEKDGNDALTITWNNVNTVSIADNDTLFQLCYTTIGECGDKSSIEIKDGPELKIEVTSEVNLNSVELEHIEVPGSVEIVCAVEIEKITVNNVECNGGSDGSIYVKMACGTCNYTYKWNDGASGASRNAIGAGNYIVTITDTDSGDFVVKTITVTEPSPLTASGSVTNEDCDNEGAITLTAVSGETSPYSYLWSNGAITKDISGVTAGSYTVKITDSKGCSELNKSFTVGSDIDELTVNKGETQNVNCFGDSDGSVSILVAGGCSPYSISWSNGAKDKNVLTGLIAGDYSVTVTDAKGKAKITQFTVSGPTSKITVAGVVTGGSNAGIDITATGGTGAYTYSWTGPTGFAGSTDEDLTGLTIGGTYSVEVTDANGCKETKSFEVVVVIDPISISDVEVSDFNGFGVKCNGDCTGTVSAKVVANPPWEVFLNGDKITLPYSGLCAGSYTLKIVDNEGLTTQATFEITEPDELSVSADEINCTDSGKEEGSVSVIVNGGISPFKYYWGKGFDDSAEITDLPKGKYSVEVTDANGCKVLSEDLKVDDCDRSDCYKGSTIISPNGDEFNEYFLIKCFEDFPTSELNVYDRLGNKVYSQSNYDGKWNGLDLNGTPLLEGSYMWVFLGYDENNNKSIYKGTVTILR